MLHADKFTNVGNTSPVPKQCIITSDTRAYVAALNTHVSRQHLNNVALR